MKRSELAQIIREELQKVEKKELQKLEKEFNEFEKYLKASGVLTKSGAENKKWMDQLRLIDRPIYDISVKNLQKRDDLLAKIQKLNQKKYGN